MENREIDGGKPFDWGRVSGEYARWRDIYPEAFYQRIIEVGLCPENGLVLDVGTGTGVLPRALAQLCPKTRFTGADIVPEQIEQARRLTAGAMRMAGTSHGEAEPLCAAGEIGHRIDYVVGGVENLAFPENTFDAVTACQCFHYFRVGAAVPNLARMLKPGGRLGILFMAWLPEEDEIGRRSEKLVLEYSPGWTGAGWRRQPDGPALPDWAARYGFAPVTRQVFDLQVAFTRESWNGRMIACRGVGASLPPEAVAAFSAGHLALLEQVAPPAFTVLHQASMLVLENRK